FVQKRNSAGGALYDMGVYHISQMLYLLGNPKVARISGKTYQKTAMDEKRRATSDYDVEELGLGLVRFDGDVTLDIIEACAITLDAVAFAFVVGERGGVRLNPFGYFRSYGYLDISGATDLNGANFRWTNVKGDADHYASPQQHWIAALQGKVELLPTAELALN